MLLSLESLSYLDIHTHRRDQKSDSVSVFSLSSSELLSSDFLPKSFSSAGIHPWWLEDFSQSELNSLKIRIEELVRIGALWGLGETGIDRAYPEFLQDQIELFHWHLELSERFNLPLIIHSVKAGSDFLQILKEKRPKSPWIFHDFRGNESLMKELLRLHSRCFFSFGLSIDNSQQIRDLLPLVPLDRLFLETDEQKHLDIQEIYLRASHFLQMDLDLLKSQIWLNFKGLNTKSTH